MRKAASQSTKRLARSIVKAFIATVIVVVLIATIQVVYNWNSGKSVVSDASATTQCNNDQRLIDLYGSVHGNKAEAINGSDFCTYQVTLVSYNMPVAKNAPGWTETQTKIKSVTTTIGPNETKNLEVGYTPSANCRVQIDLIRGGSESIIVPPFYGPTNNFMAADYIEWNCAPSPTATPVVTASPSPTPVVTASPTPVVTATPVPVVTPTASQPPRTDLTDNRSDGSRDALDCVAESKNGRKNCNQTPVVAGVSTTLPATGVVDDQTVSYALAAIMTFFLGVVLFQYVRLEEKTLN